MAAKRLRPPTRFQTWIIDRDAPSVRIDEDGVSRWYPSHFAVRWDHPDLHAIVELEFVAEPSGLRCTRVRVEPREPEVCLVTGGLMPTDAQLRQLVGFSAAAVASPVHLPPGAAFTTQRYPDGWLQQNFGVVRQTAATRRRRRVLSDDMLRDVARLYREAISLGESPRPYIASKMHAATSTVATWVQHARRRVDPHTGEPFMRPAEERKAGEVEES